MPAMLPIPQNMVTSYLPEKPNDTNTSQKEKQTTANISNCVLFVYFTDDLVELNKNFISGLPSTLPFV